MHAKKRKKNIKMYAHRSRYKRMTCMSFKNKFDPGEKRNETILFSESFG